MIPQPRALVVGGSLGGLYAALALRDAGWDVDVFERSGLALDGRGAGIVVQPDTVRYLEHRGLLATEAISTEARWRRYLGRDGGVLDELPMRQRFTAWNALYRGLRATVPDGRYHPDATLTGIRQDDGAVVATFAGGREEVGDLLVGADGARSTVRRHLLPDVAPTYAGYVAWRGLVDEGDVPPALVERFTGAFTFFQYPRSHILCYPVPGAEGELTPGRRRLNWVWYVNAAAGRELRRLLTDRHGTLRQSSVPPGEVRDELVGEISATAARDLPGPFADLVAATKEPFVQAIEDLAVPRMAFGRVCLVGDAAFVPRPHTAASTLKAALDAVSLGRCVPPVAHAVASALTAWEGDQLRIGAHFRDLGRGLGDRSQFDRD
jgi:2-polyprenyl-6-methoxyphenol hydroxylase-like FAD-dependent oxidoreductase